MSQMALIGSPALSLPRKEAAAMSARARSTWRFCPQEDSLCGVAWLVAIAGSFFLIGLTGLLKFQEFEPITFAGRAGLGAVDNEATDVSMAELMAEVEQSLVNPTEQVVEESIEIPEMIEVPLEALDMPELTEALLTEDLFTVPAAPKIESAMTPEDPAKPKPQPKKSVARAPSRPTTSTVTTTAGTAGSGGGGGGTGRIGSGSGKGRMPKPFFPSGAKNRGVTGTLTFRLVVSPAGQLVSATVIRTSCTNGGFTSSEQAQVAADIRKNWYLPSYGGQTITVPIRYKFD